MVDVGDWVVCVDATDDPRGIPVPLVRGEIYCITAIWGDLPNSKIGDFWRDIGFDLEGVPRLPGDHCYGAYRFREIAPAAEPVPAAFEEA